MKITILYSGGLDSFIMYKLAMSNYPDADIKCVYYAHGAESEEFEIASLPDFVIVKRIDWLGKDIRPKAKIEDPFAGEIYIPGRNMVFCTLAASQFLPDQIWLGVLRDENNNKATDKNTTFKNLSKSLISYVLSPFLDQCDIVFPFDDLGWTKEDSVRWALTHNTTEEELKSTISCWSHNGEPCGRCKQCFKRKLVFSINGISEKFKEDPLNSEYGFNLAKNFLTAKFLYNTTNTDELTVADLIERSLDNRLAFNSNYSEKLKDFFKGCKK